MINEYPNIFALEKIYEFLDEWIYLSKYIRIYSNIRIFVPHWLGGGWTFSQNVISLALTVWDRHCLKDSERKDYSMKEWINNYKGDCKIVPATPVC